MEKRLQYVQPLLLLLLLLVLLLLTGMKGTEGSAITCMAKTTIYETSVTCLFGIDISQTSHNLHVQFYYPNIKADPEMVLMCNWKTPSDTLCKKTNVISFSNITDRVTVRRPQSINKVRGMYVCHVVPSVDGVKPEPCNLTYEEVTITKPKTTPATQSALLKAIRDSVMSSYAVSCVALVVCLIILIVFILFIFKDRITGKFEELRKPKQERERARDAESPGTVCMEEMPEEKQLFLPSEPPKPPPQNAKVEVDISNDDNHPTGSKKKERKGLLVSGRKKDNTPEDKGKTPPAPETAPTSRPPAPIEGERSPARSIESAASAEESKPETKEMKKQRELEEKRRSKEEKEMAKQAEKERKRQEKEEKERKKEEEERRKKEEKNKQKK